MKKVILRSTGLTLITAAMVTADPTTQPATQPVALAPATQPSATTQPAVAALFSQMDAAYAKLTSARFDGSITGTFDVQGDSSEYNLGFTSSFAAPNKFQHHAAGDILLGCTGTNVYALLDRRDEYQTFQAPKTRVGSNDWPAMVTRILVDQNPSLLLTMTKSVATELNELSRQVTLEPVTLIDGVSYDTLRFDIAGDHQIITMLVHPDTHLLRQVRFDKRKSLEQQGATDVKTAMVTIDYTRIEADATLDPDQFAWSAPAGAVQATAAVAMADAGDGLSDDQKAIIGKPAGDFTLVGLDDKPLTLSTQKGSVVVLDFWATWCGPCVASLPHLNSLYKEQGPNGLKVFALDQREKKPLVSGFVTKKGWSIPVLLDSDGAVADSYKVNGIPQTVIVGKDGIIKQIYVGSGHEKEIAARVAKEMQ